MTQTLKTARARAWRNTMVAAINAGLDQKLFGLQPGQDYWPGATDIVHGWGGHHVFEFSIGGIRGLGYVRGIGWDELSIHAALWPTAEARRWIICGNITGARSPPVGDTVACGWLERRSGCYLMPSPALFYCKAARKPVVAGLDVTPQGFKDRGRFII